VIVIGRGTIVRSLATVVGRELKPLNVTTDSDGERKKKPFIKTYN
jgi:hypothetical protein